VGSGRDTGDADMKVLVDRIDSGKNYTNDNIVSCCKVCNQAKRDMSISEFYSWVKRISAMAEQWG
jgi:hypothetical protein